MSWYGQAAEPEGPSLIRRLCLRAGPGTPASLGSPGGRIMLAGLALTAALWALLSLMHGGSLTWAEGHAPIDAGPTLAGATALVVAGASLLWLTMMAAMMTPAVLPWVALLAKHDPSPGSQEPPASGDRSTPYLRAASLLAGYLTVWGIFSLAAAALQVLLWRHSLLVPESLGLGTKAAGGLLLFAGAYELTPIKSACLRRCRSPLALYLTSWRSGPASGFRIGARHGLVCVACCWALMALAFAAGVTSLLGMAFLTGIVCAQKLLPRGDRLPRFLGAALLVGGILLLI